MLVTLDVVFVFDTLPDCDNPVMCGAELADRDVIEHDVTPAACDLVQEGLGRLLLALLALDCAAMR